MKESNFLTYNQRIPSLFIGKLAQILTKERQCLPSSPHLPQEENIFIFVSWSSLPGLFFLTGCGTVPAPGSEALFTPAKELQPVVKDDPTIARERYVSINLDLTTSRPKKRLLSP